MRSIIAARPLLKQVLQKNFRRSIYVETESWGVFPREREGNNYDLNFSLLEDGVTSVGDSFRNARIQLLSSRLPEKVENGKINMSHPLYFGKYEVKEAGDNMSLDDFTSIQSTQQEVLSNGSEIFVEDAGLGTFSPCRVGTRVVSHSAAVSLILRQMMLPLSPRPLDHRARFTGWTSDERYEGVITPEWQETSAENEKGSYVLHDRPIEAAKGHRPIGAFIGGDNDAIAVQFVEHKGAIVGGNIIAGSRAPMRGVVAAMGHASNVLINAEFPEGVALSSSCFTNKAGDSVLIVDADDEVTDAVAKKHALYGAYNNIVVPSVGVSAMWNGVIDGSKDVTTSTACRPGADRDAVVPNVVVDGVTARSLDPVNLVNAPKHILFFEAGAKKTQLKESEAAERIVGASDESKAAIAARLVTGAKLYVVGSAEDAVSVL